jgi:amino acid adenylation domain-containing protein
MYGTMMAGAAYVPIDPASPVLRAATIAADCTVAALATTPDRAAATVTALGGHRPRSVILVDGAGNGGAKDDIAGVPVLQLDDIVRSASPRPSVPVIDTDLAYLLYTSGTTGTPKGVMLNHRHALTFVEWCASTIGSTADDRFSNHAPFHFDLSVFDLYVAAHGGASVHVVPPAWAYFGHDLARFIDEEGITVWYSVPSALTILTRAAPEGRTFPSLRAVVFAGEVYPTKHLRALRSLVPDATLWNLYGPTETNVCTYLRVGELPADDSPIPIGRACENTEVFALTDDGRPAAVGETGELYVRGSSLMSGYWGRSERSANVLVPDPRERGTNELVYRTGDLVRLRPDGDLDFLGRRDHQVKSRGYRIELGEIESALHALPEIEESVAVAVPHEEWGNAIVAFVIVDGDGLVDEMEIKRSLATRLPRYMIPARIEVAVTLPRTSTGKVDRRWVIDEAATRAWSWR